MISVGSLIFGIGLSSNATLYGPLKTTALIVSFAILAMPAVSPMGNIRVTEMLAL
jgi:hypothetical protein